MLGSLRRQEASSFLHIYTEVRLDCGLEPLLFNPCMDCVLGRRCVSSFSNTFGTDLVYVNDAVIPTELLEILVITLASLPVFGASDLLGHYQGQGVGKVTA